MNDDPDSHDPEGNDDGGWIRLTDEEALAGIREGRRIQLMNAIGLLQMIPERRAIEAAIEVLHDAVATASLDAWTEGMREVMERSRQESLDLLQQH